MVNSERYIRSSRITIPQHAHPLSKLCFRLMRDTGTTYQEAEFRSGVLRQTIKSWRNEKVGSLRSYEAVLGSFGWSLVPVPPLDNVPEHVREQLEEVGQHFVSDDETLAAAIYAATSKPRYHEGRAPRVQYHTPYWLEAAA